ncbi:MAG TPA: YbbR-like domain-containing protein [Acidobacteriota bacterium]|nr:YbbR-like domain-containing protein [Acidobacteriota bacterium]
MSIVGAIGEWLRSLFFDNIGLKLASFVLALLLYAHVVTEQQKEEVLRIPVACVGLADTLAILGKPPTELDVTFRGKWKDLIRLRLSNSLLRVELDHVGPGFFRHEVTPEEIGERALPPELAKIVEITQVAEPHTIELQVEPKTEKRIVVRPRIVGEPAAGWRVEGPATVDPESVLVTGPWSAVWATDSLETLPVDITEEREKIQRQVSVDPGTQPLVPEPRRILVTLRLVRAATDSTAARL